MIVYPVVNERLPHSPHTPQSETWPLDYASKLEQRLELGRHVSDEARQWLTKPSQLCRFALWNELLVHADIDGVCDVATLSSWALFDTERKRGYVLQMLEAHGLVTRLSGSRVQVVC